jgi:hypothetical protein
MAQRDEVPYLTYWPGLNKSGTTRLRPIFVASPTERGQPSVNQCLEKGMNLIEIIPTLLLRFLFHQIAIIADIRKAFLQISLCQENGFPQV